MGGKRRFIRRIFLQKECHVHKDGYRRCGGRGNSWGRKSNSQMYAETGYFSISCANGYMENSPNVIRNEFPLQILSEDILIHGKRYSFICNINRVIGVAS